MFLMTLFLTFFLKRSRKPLFCYTAIRVEFHKHCIASRLDSIWYFGSTKFFSQHWWCCRSAVSDFKIIPGTWSMVFNLEVKLLCYNFVQESLFKIRQSTVWYDGTLGKQYDCSTTWWSNVYFDRLGII